VTEQPFSGAPVRSHPARRAGGALAAVIALLGLVVLVWSLWNTRRYVALLTYAANPFGVGFVTLIAATLAVWLLLPVRNEAAQGGRTVLRWFAVVVTVLSGLALALTLGMPAFAYQGRVLVHAPGDRYDLALVDRGGENKKQLRVWRGHGLSARDLGNFGDVCGGQVEVRFASPTEFEVSTLYGTFHLRVDPAGRPANSLGPTCSG
jgi:hypothetical protein